MSESKITLTKETEGNSISDKLSESVNSGVDSLNDTINNAVGNAVTFEEVDTNCATRTK